MSLSVNNAMVLLSIIVLASCGDLNDLGEESDDGIGSGLPLEVPPVTTGNWYQPGVLTTWQWQLKGALNTGYNVDVYDIDLFDTSIETIQQLQANNHKVISI